MRIGYVCAEGKGEADRLLGDLAGRLLARRLRLAGVVQVNSDRADGNGCDMDVTVLPSGPVIRISQSLGSGSSGCRLDAGALEQAVGLVEPGLSGAELLMINKFGKHEAEGRGFRDLIGAALAEGIPVLAGVNPKNLAAFLAFAGEFAVALPADVPRLEAWVLETAGQPA